MQDYGRTFLGPMTMKKSSGGYVDARAYDTAGTQSAITKAITDIGTDERTLYIAPGDWTITTNLSIPSNITLRVDRGCNFITTAAEITIYYLEAGAYKIFSVSGTGKITLGTGIEVINAAWWGDDRDAIQSAIDCYVVGVHLPKIRVPGGDWDITECLDATDHWEVWMAGDASGASFEGGTILRANSGLGKAVLDTVGSRLRLDDIVISVEGVTNQSSIGIIMGSSSTYAPPVYDGQSTFNRLSNVSVNMGSRSSANNGLGTVALINDCAEETSYSNVRLQADLPLLITSDHTLDWIDNHTYTVASEYVTMSPTYPHNAVHNFFGVSLSALNSHRPALAFQGVGIDLGSMFAASLNTSTTVGTYSTAILCGDTYGMKGAVQTEGFNTAFDLKGQFENFDVSVMLESPTGTKEMVTVNTSNKITNGNMRIMLPNLLIDTNRKFLNATVPDQNEWPGSIHSVNFETNLTGITEPNLIGGVIAYKIYSGSLKWANGHTEYFSTPGGGRGRRMAFGYSLGTFNESPKQLTETEIATITLPTGEQSQYKGGIVTCKFDGQITTAGAAVVYIAARSFTATGTIICDKSKTISCSDSSPALGYQTDLTVGSLVVLPAGQISISLDSIDMVVTPSTKVLIVPFVTGSGAYIIGRSAFINGFAEFYMMGWNTRLPDISMRY